MSKSARKLREIVEYLSDQLTRGWAALWVAQQIDRAHREEQLDCASSFLTTTYDACVESAILALARLTVAHKDSISVAYLLNCVDQSPSAFPLLERPAVADAVARHRALLLDLQPLVDRVKDYRDRTIAHLDKRHVNQNGVISARPPIDLREVEGAFERTLLILNAYRGYLDQPARRLDNLHADLVRDWIYLHSLLEQDNATTGG